MTKTKKFLILGVILALLGGLFVFLPDTLKGSFLKSDVVNEGVKPELPPLNSDLNNGYTKNPASGITDIYNNIYIVDTGNHRIQKFDSTGKFLMKFGTEGSGDGQFKSPQAIALDAYSNIYVVDTGNHRIQKFDSTGKFLMKFGTEGSGDKQFQSPTGIMVDAYSNIYVVDTGNHRIQKFDSTGKFLMKFGTEGSGDGQFKSPRNIVKDMYGSLYIVDTGNHRIQKFDSTGKFLMKFGTEGSGDGQFKSPNSATFDKFANLWVTDTGNNRIQRFNISGKHLGTYKEYPVYYFSPLPMKSPISVFFGVNSIGENTISVLSDTGVIRAGFVTSTNFNITGFQDYNFRVGKGKGQFDGGMPGKMFTQLNGELYVFDGRNRRIQRFDKQGNYLGEITGYHNFSERYMVMDSKGNMYFHDPRDPRFELSFIRKFDVKGNYLTSFVAGSGKMFIDKNDIIYTTNSNNTNITRYNTSGTLLSQFTYNISYIEDLTFDNNGNIYVVFYGPTDKSIYCSIRKYSSEGVLLQEVLLPTSIVTPYGLSSAFSINTEVEVDNENNIYLYFVDGGNVILKFDSSGAFIKRYTGQLGYGEWGFLTGKKFSQWLSLSLKGEWYIPPHSSMKEEYPVTYRYITEDNIELEASKVEFIPAVSTKEISASPKTCVQKLEEYAPGQRRFVCENPQLEYSNYVFSEFRGDCMGTQTSCSLLMDGPKEVTMVYRLLPKVTKFQLPEMTRTLTVPILGFEINKSKVVGYIITEDDSSIPKGDDPRWSANKPTQYIFSKPIETYSPGKLLLYVWLKDERGVINLGGEYISDSSMNNMLGLSFKGGRIEYKPYQLSLGANYGGKGYILESVIGTNQEVIWGSVRESYPEGTNLSLKAVANYGYTFTGWSGDCSGIKETCMIIMDSDKNFIPKFEKAARVYYTTPDATYRTTDVLLGQKVSTLPPPPERNGYEFTGWYTSPSGGDEFTKDTIVTKDVYVYAQWKQVTLINGVCGTTNNTCTAGTLSDTIDSSTEYFWSCTGQGTGTTAQCSLNKPINGTCGPAAKTYSFSDAGYETNNAFCASGSPEPAIPAFPDPGGVKEWSCSGLNGGNGVICTASKTHAPIVSISGTCGITKNTCATGNIQNIAESTTKYLWSCSGQGGGATTTCTLDKEITEVAVKPPEVILGSAPRETVDTTPPTQPGFPTIAANTTSTRLLGITGVYTNHHTLTGTIACESGDRLTWYNGIMPVGQSLCENARAVWSLTLGYTSDYVPLTFVATDSTGNTSSRSAIFGVWYEYLRSPAAPQNLTSSVIANGGQIILTWAAPTDVGSAPITDYILEYRGNGPLGKWRVYNDGVSTQKAMTISNLSAGAYSFRVAAKSNIGTSGFSNTITATITRAPRIRVVPPSPLPNAPTNMVVTPITGGVQLKFSAPTYIGTSPITDYVIEYKPSSSTIWKIFNDGTSTNLTATVNGLVTGKYDFRISAKNTSGQGAVSTIVSTTVVRGVRQRVVVPVR